MFWDVDWFLSFFLAMGELRFALSRDTLLCKGRSAGMHLILTSDFLFPYFVKHMLRRISSSLLCSPLVDGYIFVFLIMRYVCMHIHIWL